VGRDPGNVQLYVIGLLAVAMLCGAMVLEKGGAW